MPLLHEKELEDKVRQVVRDYLASLPVEELQQTFSEEKLQHLLQSLPAEERLKGMPAEERLKGLTPEELERLKKLLN